MERTKLLSLLSEEASPRDWREGDCAPQVAQRVGHAGDDEVAETDG